MTRPACEAPKFRALRTRDEDVTAHGDVWRIVTTVDGFGWWREYVIDDAERQHAFDPDGLDHAVLRLMWLDLVDVVQQLGRTLEPIDASPCISYDNGQTWETLRPLRHDIEL